MSIGIVYGLIDPLTNELRYVGITKRKLTLRLREHLADPYMCHKWHWIRKLLEKGLVPEIFVIEEEETQYLEDAERFWISYFRFLGCALTNHSGGGLGFNMRHSAEAKRKMSVSHKKLGRSYQLGKIALMRAAQESNPEQYRRNLSQALKGKKKTKEHGANISKGQTGHTVKESTREKLRKALTGKKQSQELIEKRIAPLRGKRQSPEHVAKRANAIRKRKNAKSA